MNHRAIIVHGGCGRIDESTLRERLEGLKKAAVTGWAVLKEGGSAVDAVESAVVVLEDLPLFNAARGSVLNSEGHVENDAAIMNGASRAAGAVASVTGVRNPITLARRVMEASPHVMLVGNGAERFAVREGIPRCGEDYLVVEQRRAEWKDQHGTVGAVARDREGRLAAATSTGGKAGKLPGRVGDSPIIGAGTYADSRIGVSCTGDGEHILRMTLARLVAFFYERHEDARRALEEAVDQMNRELGGEVGLIAVDFKGKTAFVKNSQNMPVCAIDADGVILQC